MPRVWTILLIAASLSGTCSAWGQAGSNWDRVKAIDAGTPLRLAIHGRTRFACKFADADDSQIACLRTHAIFFVPVTQRMVFRRDQVVEVRLTKPLLSGLAGGAIGVGAGIGAGFGLQNQATRDEDPELLPAALGMVGGLLGGAIGLGTDFLGGPVIYRTP